MSGGGAASKWLGWRGLAVGLALLAAAAGGLYLSAHPAQRIAALTDMAAIPAGSFVMGVQRPTEAMEASPARRVTVKGFRMSRRDVTFAEYDAFAVATGRPFPPDGGWGRGRNPVVNVSWADVQAYIGWLNTGTGRRFRLPTDAEWEYAAHGGGTSTYWWGDKLDPAKAAADLGARPPGPAPVGQFPANGYGLFDMAGNVWQRVEDCWHADYRSTPTDGRPYLGGTCHGRIARGGSWFSAEPDLRVVARASVADAFAGSTVGFRLAESRN